VQPWAHICQVMKGLNALGVPTYLLSFGDHNRSILEFCDGTPVYRIPGKFTLNKKECIRVLKEIDPDVTDWFGGLLSALDIVQIANSVNCKIVWNITQRRILHDEMSLLGLSELCRFPGLGVIYSYHLLPEALFRSAAAHSHAIVVASNRSKRSLVDMGIPTRKIHVICSGVDGELFSQVREEGFHEIRIANGFSGNDFIVCYFGPVSALRGIDTAIEAFRILRARIPNARLLILARSCVEDRWLLKISKNIVGIKLISRSLGQEDIAKFLMASDVVLLPFRFWPFNDCPLTVLESMAAAKSVVTTSTGFAGDLIVNGVNGFLVRPGDPLGVANIVLSLAKDEDKRLKIGINARNTVLNNYDWKHVAMRTLDLFRFVCT